MNKLYLRSATMADVQLLFDWANDPAVRENSFSSAQIRYEEHEKWFATILASDAARLFILMKQEMPIGQIRLELREGAWRISYSVAALYRGRGYGRILLEMMENELISSQDTAVRLSADVRTTSPRSSYLSDLATRRGTMKATMRTTRQVSIAFSTNRE